MSITNKICTKHDGKRVLQDNRTLIERSSKKDKIIFVLFVQHLKTIRHPNILKFFTGFKTFVDHDSFIADCVHPLANKLDTNDMDSSAKICLGLYQLSQALEFLHEKVKIQKEK